MTVSMELYTDVSLAIWSNIFYLFSQQSHFLVPVWFLQPVFDDNILWQIRKNLINEFIFRLENMTQLVCEKNCTFLVGAWARSPISRSFWAYTPDSTSLNNWTRMLVVR